MHKLRAPKRRGHARSRRAVILLFVMALLALFALVTVTFVIVAHSHRQSTIIATNVGRTVDTPQLLLNRAINEVLVGSNNPHSSLQGVSLLEDMYGNDGLLGTVIPNPDPGTNNLPPLPWSLYGQLLRFNATFDNPSPLAALAGAMSGRVLTITSGALKGNSFRIVSFDSTANILLMTVVVEGMDAATAATQLAPRDRFLVNGRPFNGTGAGFDTGPNMQGVLTRAATPGSTPQSQDSTFPFLGAVQFDPSMSSPIGPFALLPNARFFSPNPLYLDVNGPGGADEEYDAADMQNMLMAFERVPINPGDASVAIPSLHRPELVHYWLQNQAAASNNAVSYPPGSGVTPAQAFVQLWKQNNAQGLAARRILRRAMMRPIGGFPEADHPEFTGSNPGLNGFDPVLGGRDVDNDGTPDFYWDVDNDGDGMPDSIWVDIGLPPQLGPQGRMVKPLVSILCLDQDGKFNLNAHGTLAQANDIFQRDMRYWMANGANASTLPNYLMNWPTPLSPIGGSAPDAANYGYPFPPAGTSGSQPIILPEGSGYGPAEINLRPLFINNPAEYLRLLQGWPTNAGDWSSGGSQSVRIDGRYGESQRFATGSSPTMYPTPGSVSADPRVNWQGRLRQSDLPYSFWETTPLLTSPSPNPNPATAYMTPPDLNGDGAVAYDMHGQAIYRNMGEANFAAGVSEKVASPYDIDLSRRATRGQALPSSKVGGIDSPFTPAEWERLLRYNDIDAASMPRRLLDLANSAFETGAAPGQTPNPVMAAINRKFVTTESWDANVASLLPTMELGGEIAAFGFVPTNLQFADLVLCRLLSPLGGPAFLTSATDTVKANRALHQLLPWELLSGSKMDVNRPFGNGRDDSQPGTPGNSSPGFGIVDEPISMTRGGQLSSEVADNDLQGRAGEHLWDDLVYPSPIALTAAGGVRMDHNNDGTFNFLVPTKAASPPAPGPIPNPMNAENNDLLARQLYARHMYVMICSLTDQKLIKTIVDIHNLVDSGDPWTTFDVYRRFAQWAVNIVDARDSDSIMTPFEFDINPFKDDTGTAPNSYNRGFTWNVDDNPATAEGTTSGAGWFRGVVWGCERPELLMTESIAWHDRRTADTKNDNGIQASHYQPTDPNRVDPDFDQVARPQGGVFIELYVPWNAPISPNPTQTSRWGTGSQLPAEFYELQNGLPVFHLNRTTPTGDPVWRMAVVNDDRDIDKAPDNPRSDKGTNIDRTIYFTSGATNVKNISPDSEEPFFRQGTPANIYIPPGGYAVVGGTDLTAGNTPTKLTTIRGQAGGAGSKVDLNMTYNPFPSPTSGQSAVAVDGNGTQILNTLGRPQGPTAVVVHYTNNGPRRLSLSEPYTNKEPAGTYTTEDDTKVLTDDKPWDATNAILLKSPSTMNGTARKKFTVFLQRLANPLLAWNPDDPSHPSFKADRPVNPFITVDSIPVDLTVYNSQAPQTNPNAGEIEPGIPSPPAGNFDFRFSTRERGFMDQGRPNIWCNRFSTAAGQPSGQDPVANAPTKLDKESLGYLNRVFGTPLASNNPYDTALSSAVGSGSKLYQGDPSVPFPAMPWLNRPFANPMELMLVPGSHPFELLNGFGCRDPIVSPANAANALKNPYLVGANYDDPFRVVPYGILGPFFMSQVIPASLIPPGLGVTPPAYSMPNLFRFFDFFQVPSRFAGTDTVLSPVPQTATAFGVDPSRPSSIPPENIPRRLYPPFNRISRFREPGKMNINTIANPGVWAGLVNGTTDTPISGSPQAQTTVQWLKVMLSRRGSTPTIANIPAFALKPDPVPNLLVDPPLDTTGAPLPTYFAAPFRSYAGTYLVPTAGMRLFNGGLFKGTSPALPRNEIDSTLLRMDQFTAMSPLFSNAVSVNASFTPTEVNGPSYADPVGNAAVFYRSMHKLSGLTTTRSNVYAVWVTLGFFECDSVPQDEGHPDGYRLGREAGIDTGDVRRHRAFFIVDRSIPVGFQRGEAHNTEKAVLLRRFIE